MKKIILIVLLVFTLILGMLPAFAAETNASATTGSVAVKVDASVAVEDAGILPTSSFYFLKEWGRGIRRTFTFNATSRAEYELKVADQKAIELRKVEQLDPKNSKAIQQALDNYNENASRLKARLVAIKETSKNPKVDELLTKFTSKTIEHQKLLEELKEKHPDIKDKFEAIQVLIDQAIIEIPNKFDGEGKFAEKIQAILDNDKENNLAELKIAAVLERLESAKAGGAVSERMADIKDNLIIKFGGRVSSGEIEVDDLEARLGALPVTDTTRLKVLDEIKEQSTDAKLKIKLEGLRPQIIKEIERKDKVSGDEAKQTIEYAKSLLAKAEGLVGQSSAAKSLAVGLANAKTRLQNAEILHKGGKYGAAFGEANAASAITKRVIDYFQKKEAGLSGESSELRARFDKLVAIAKEKGLYTDVSSELYVSFVKVEKLIVGIKTIDDARRAKEMLAEIESLIRIGGRMEEGAGKIEVSGYILSGGETTPIGLYDAPRSFVYKAKLESGSLIAVSYLAYPPSPAADLRKVKISIEGSVTAGDYFKARGTFDKDGNTLAVSGSGDYFITAKRTVKPSTIPPTTVICTREYAPVCGADGKTYPNKCNASAVGAEVSYVGQCKATVAPPVEKQYCTQEYAPVCGSDGKTYSNKCFAGMNGVEVKHEGQCSS